MANVWINGRSWYSYLKPQDDGNGLLDHHSKGDLVGALIVQYEIPRRLRPHEGKTRVYGIFTSGYVEFWLFNKSLDPSNRCFYETIIGSMAQKPHFDVDLEIEGSEYEADMRSKTLICELLNVCKEMLEGWMLNLDVSKDILLFSSHGTKVVDNRYLHKRSYHLIIDNYCHRNHDEAKEFHRQVVARITHPDRLSIDPKVYSSKQQFRLWGSTKEGKNRPKELITSWDEGNLRFNHPEWVNPNGRTEISIFSSSLVSNTSYCKLLPVLETPERIYANDVISDQDYRLAIDILLAWSTDFAVDNFQGNIITLHRLNPSFCPLCFRVHDAENPYLLLSEGKILWNCRRTDQFFNLGSLPQKLEEPTEVRASIPIQPQSKVCTLDVIGSLAKLAKADMEVKIGHKTPFIPHKKIASAKSDRSAIQYDSGKKLPNLSFKR